MDEDFYIEKTSPLKIILYVIIFLGLIGYGIYYYVNYHKENYVKLKSITLELGAKLPTNIEYYIEADNISKYKINLSSISVDDAGNVDKVGEYSYKIKKDSTTKKGKVYVKDTTKPNAIVEDLTVGVNEKFDVSEFVLKCEDLSMPCNIKYKNIKDEELNKKEGTYSLDIIISDSENNSVTKTVKLIVKGENTLANKKASDLTFDHLSEEDLSWDKTYTLKLEKGLNEETEEYDQIIDKLLSQEYDFEKKVQDKKILVIYNKYNYVLGFSIKVTFSDNSVIYITDSNASLKSEEE